jgi:hypothetical protein
LDISGSAIPVQVGPLKRRRLVDRFRHAYAEWQWRSAAVWAAYERWTEAAASPDRSLEFAAYRVALDLEERACRHYMELAQRVSDGRSGAAAQAAAAA